MLRNYVMPLRSVLFILCVVFSFSSPVQAQESTNNEEIDIFGMTVEDYNDDQEAITGPIKKKGNEVEIGADFFISLGINLATLALIIGLIYYPNYKKMDTVFTFILFNVSIFMLTYVFNVVKISMGAAFGLFAVFSMLRYRTSGISMKDMTYLLISITLGLLSAIQMEYYEQVILGGVAFAIIFVMDTRFILKKESSKSIRFEDINLIQPEKETELINVLKKRTGLDIHRISIEEIDFLRDIAMINVYYYEK